jgi:hypothetical protein
MAKWQKGQSGNPDGRKSGTTNRLTKAVKDALLESLNEGAGATAFFISLKNSKRSEDRRTFAQLCGRLISTELTGAGGAPLTPEFCALETARRIAFILNTAVRELPHDQMSHGSHLE